MLRRLPDHLPATHDGHTIHAHALLIHAVINDTDDPVVGAVTVIQLPQHRGARLSRADQHGADLAVPGHPSMDDGPQEPVREPLAQQQNSQKQNVQDGEASGHVQIQQIHDEILQNAHYHSGLYDTKPFFNADILPQAVVQAKQGK